MQLQLQAYGQVIGNHPVGQIARVQVVVAGREQHLTGTAVKAVLDQLGIGPVVVFTGTNHELDLIVGRQQFDVLVAVAMHFLGARRLEVNHSADTRVYSGNIQGPAGFQGDLVTGITQLFEQGDGVGLGQGLATRYTDVAGPVAGNLFQDVFEGAHGAATEGVGAVTVLATQGATGQAHKNRGQASGSRFTL